MRGRIKRLFRDLGYGFIRVDDGREVFFHRSNLQQLDFEHLEEGDSVEFEMETTPKGPRAMKVRRALEQR